MIDMLKRERQVQFEAQIKRMIVRKEKIFLDLDQLSPAQLLMFYVALCLDREDARRLNYVEEKIQRLNANYLKLLISVL